MKSTKAMRRQQSYQILNIQSSLDSFDLLVDRPISDTLVSLVDRHLECNSGSGNRPSKYGNIACDKCHLKYLSGERWTFNIMCWGNLLATWKR
jgi:hypothetical protein